MKFTWFNLMPWPYLPDDFREKHRSVWVDIPNRLYDPVKGNAVYHEYMDQLEYAEELGFDGIGVNEHHQNGYGLMPSPNIIAATLARRTSQAAIAVIGNSIALYNPPIRVAEEFAMLDVISGGRLIAGFPVGTPMDTNFCYGQIPALTRDKYAEAHTLIRRAWAEEEPFAFDGKYNQLRWVNCWPKPIQKPHPPVYIPGGGSVETFDFCIDYDYNYSYLSFNGYLAAKSLMDSYWERVAARGKDASPHRAAFAQIIAVADTDAEAERLYKEHILYFYNRCLHVAPAFQNPPGYRTIKTIKATSLQMLQRRAQGREPEVTWQGLVDGGMVIAGSPETVRQRMEELIKTLRVGHVFCLLHTGNQPDEKTRHNSRLFAQQVMPKLRHLWPEWDTDDRWWIHPPGGARQAGAAPMTTRTIQTARGARVRVLDFGNAANAPLVFLHGISGLLDDTSFFDLLAARHHVYVPELPGYGESSGEELLEDMLDFTLHGWDVVVALGIQQPVLVGHSMGGMLAAEMACLAPEAISKLVLVNAYGLWLEDEPIPDIFAFLPFEFGDYLFHNPERAAALLTGATDAADPESLRDFFISNARSLGTAGKMLFPIPNRRLSKRLYRLTTETLVVWGDQDRLMGPAYARRWGELLPRSRVVCVADAGHMLPYEQPAALAQEVLAFKP